MSQHLQTTWTPQCPTTFGRVLHICTLHMCTICHWSIECVFIELHAAVHTSGQGSASGWRSTDAFTDAWRHTVHVALRIWIRANGDVALQRCPFIRVYFLWQSGSYMSKVYGHGRWLLGVGPIQGRDCCGWILLEVEIQLEEEC